MFFLGISAHLFIYLLVPAFLVVCFYFRGTMGNPEVTNLLPGNIIYEHTLPSSSGGQTYYYGQEQEEQSEPEKQPVHFLKVLTDQGFPLPSVFYPFNVSTTVALRAPPVSFSFQ